MEQHDSRDEVEAEKHGQGEDEVYGDVNGVDWGGRWGRHVRLGER